MRVQSNTNNTVKAFIASDLSDITVDIYSSYKLMSKLNQMGIGIKRTTPLKSVMEIYQEKSTYGKFYESPELFHAAIRTLFEQINQKYANE